MKAHKSYTGRVMQNPMIKLSIAIILGLALCATVKAADNGSDQSLLAGMEQVAGLAREAVPLAKQEFAVLNQKFKGDGDLLARISTPAERANGIWWEDNVQAFGNRVKAKDRYFVAAIMITVLGELRGLDGVMLAEAVAGSPPARTVA